MMIYEKDEESNYPYKQADEESVAKTNAGWALKGSSQPAHDVLHKYQG